MGIYKMDLAFQTIQCRCGETRSRGTACECGAVPDAREVNQPVVRRRQTIALARKLAAGTHLMPVDALEELAELLADAVAQCLKGMSATADGTDHAAAAKELSSGLAQLARARAAADDLPELRPMLAIRRLLRATAAGAYEAVETWLTAFTESLPLDAQRRADAAQERLDEATEVAGDLADLLADLGEAADLGPDEVAEHIMLRAGLAWRDRAPLTAAVRRLLPDNADDAYVMTLYIEQERVRYAFDPERFWAIVHRVSDALQTNERFLELAGSLDWADAYTRQMTAVEDANRIARLVAEHSSDPRLDQRMEVEQFVKSTEATARFVLRTRLMVEQGREWAGTKQTLRPLIEAATSAGWADDLGGLDAVARNAFVHCDYDFGDDHDPITRLDPGAPSETKLTWDEFQDLKLTCLESTSAMLLAITLALWQHDDDLPWRSAVVAAPVEDLVRGLHAALTEPVRTLQLVDGTLALRYEGGLPDGIVGAAYATASLLGDQIDELRYEGDETTLEIAVADVRRNGRIDVSEPLQLASFLTSVRVDGAPLADTNFIRHIAVAEILAAREAQRQAIPRLRQVRNLMAAVGDTDGPGVVTAVIRACREAIMDDVAFRLPPAILEVARGWSQGPMPEHRLTRSVLGSQVA